MDIISVIIPVYNVAPFIRECLQSVQQQTYRELEIILIDDGSTDDSGQICDSFAETDNRFTVVHKSNSGVSSARNSGIERATGQHIAFIDPDDYISPQYFERLYFGLVENNADLAIAETISILENGMTVPKLRKGKNVVVEGNAAVIEGIFETRITCTAWGKLFKCGLWKDTRFPIDLTVGEDVATVIGVCAEAARAVYCHNTEYYYRLRAISLSRGTISAKRYAEYLSGAEIMKQQLIKKAPGRVSEIDKMKDLHVIVGAANYRISNPHIAKNKSRSTLKNICSGLKEAGYTNASDEVTATIGNHKVTQLLKTLLARGK
jgi:glycosyltransferase involved in cell wall biosynthesis